MKLTLAVPGLTWLDAHDGSELAHGMATPALARLLGRSRLMRRPARLASLLSEPFAAPGSALAVPAARLDGLPAGDGHWLIVDPAHCRVERDRVQLADIGVMQLTLAEAGQFVELLNRHFADDGLHFFAPTPARWYLRSEQPIDALFAPLADVVGENIDDFRAQGARGLDWSRVQNEIQMLLFEHPLNQAREARGELALNSVWLWGAGEESPAVAPICTIRGEHQHLMLLSRIAGIDVDVAPYSFSAWQSMSRDNRDEWLLLDRMLAAAQYRDAWGWRDALAALEQAWFAPALQALARGDLAELELRCHGDAGFRASLTRRDLWKFWRSDRALADLY